MAINNKTKMTLILTMTFFTALLLMVPTNGTVYAEHAPLSVVVDIIFVMVSI